MCGSLREAPDFGRFTNRPYRCRDEIAVLRQSHLAGQRKERITGKMPVLLYSKRGQAPMGAHLKNSTDLATKQMKLLIDPLPSLPLFSLDPELVIRIAEDRTPEVYIEEGVPKPDRHLLLGIAQSILISVEEMDPESVELMGTCAIKLEISDQVKDLGDGLVIVRVRDGRFGALATGDSRFALRLARQGVRWFTGTVRLDIP